MEPYFLFLLLDLNFFLSPWTFLAACYLLFLLLLNFGWLNFFSLILTYFIYSNVALRRLGRFDICSTLLNSPLLILVRNPIIPHFPLIPILLRLSLPLILTLIIIPKNRNLKIKLLPLLQNLPLIFLNLIPPIAIPKILMHSLLRFLLNLDDLPLDEGMDFFVAFGTGDGVFAADLHA